MTIFYALLTYFNFYILSLMLFDLPYVVVRATGIFLTKDWFMVHHYSFRRILTEWKFFLWFFSLIFSVLNIYNYLFHRIYKICVTIFSNLIFKILLKKLSRWIYCYVYYTFGRMYLNYTSYFPPRYYWSSSIIISLPLTVR